MNLPASIRRAVVVLALASAAGAVATPGTANAGAPEVKTQAPGFYRFILGDFEITALSDGTIDFPMDQLLKNIAPAALQQAFARSFLKPPIETSMNQFVINTGTRLVLVDAGAGSVFGPTLGNTVTSLRAAGYTPEEVDEVLITHMHADHVGGLVAEGKVVYPNAVLRVSKRDTDYWLNPTNEATADPAVKGNFPVEHAAFDPYIAAGKLKTFEGDTQIVPGIKAIAAPGHTPGHVFYEIESKGQKLLLWGDVAHAAAVQFADPMVTIAWDSDQHQAEVSREQAFADAAKKGYWIAGAHLPFPAFGHVRAEGNGYVYVPINYTENRDQGNSGNRDKSAQAK